MKLDFTLPTITERIEYVNNLLKTFTPTETEIAKMSDYILYGKDKDTGKNGVQEGLFTIESRYSHWNKEPVESLDALLENPLFSEITLHQIPTKKTREVFSREDARKEAPPQILSKLEALWDEIDFLELTTNFYDIKVGRRKNPPRNELLSRFTPERIAESQQLADKLTQKKYYDMRHVIIDMRQEQYSLRDAYRPQIFSEITPIFYEEDPFEFGVDMYCFPENTISQNPIAFRGVNVCPDNFTETEKNTLIRNHWAIRNSKKRYIDFTNEQHVTALLTLVEEVAAMPELQETLQFYIENAQLLPSQREIVNMKLQQCSNAKIQEHINKTYGTKHTENYISTIFHKIIIPRICEAAELHGQVIENITFPEQFKTCKLCGETLFKSTHNFVRRQRSSDGFAYRCKRCDKKVREQNDR